MEARGRDLTTAVVRQQVVAENGQALPERRGASVCSHDLAAMKRGHEAL